MRTLRLRLAQLVWAVCVGCALILATGALLIALRGSATNPDNALYQLVVDTADLLDLGVLSRSGDLFDFGESTSRATLEVLANWGLAAVAWLVVGRVLDRLIRP